MFKSVLAATVLAAAIVAPAAAVTITVDQSFNTPDVPFTVTSQSFNLPSGFTNALLNITSGTADDLAVVQINGVNIAGFGIFGPGNGNVFFTQAGPSQPYTFAFNNGAINTSFGAPFVVGNNTITIVVNNNNAGINTGNGGLTGGPNSLDFVGTVTFDAAPAVPEPQTWTLLIAGFAMTGFAMRRSTTRAAA